MVQCGSQTGYQKDTCVIEIELHAQNMISIIGLIVNIIIINNFFINFVGRGSIWPFNKDENLHFGNEYDIYSRSKKL